MGERQRILAGAPTASLARQTFEPAGITLRGYHEFKVGINWQGNVKYAGDFHRSIPLKFFEPLSRVPGVRLLSLQKNDGVEQLAHLAGKFEVTELGSRLDVDSGPFMDTAAVMTCLELFVTSHAAVARLAGSLGVPVWMPLSCRPMRWRRSPPSCDPSTKRSGRSKT